MKASYEEILERLNRQLSTIAADGAEFDESTDLVEGLGLDSFKVLDLLMEIEAVMMNPMVWEGTSPAR